MHSSQGVVPRVHQVGSRLRDLDEALRITPAVALGIAERPWLIGDLLDAVIAIEPAAPTAQGSAFSRNRGRQLRARPRCIRLYENLLEMIAAKLPVKQG